MLKADIAMKLVELYFNEWNGNKLIYAKKMPKSFDLDAEISKISNKKSNSQETLGDKIRLVAALKNLKDTDIYAFMIYPEAKDTLPCIIDLVDEILYAMDLFQYTITQLSREFELSFILMLVR